MKVYIAVDGDGVGSKLSQLLNSHASDSQVAHFAMGVQNEMQQFASRATLLGATVMLCSGDSVLLSANGEQVSDILRGLKETKLATYTCGTGRSAIEAALCLQYGKMNGKNQTWHWQTPKPFWLKIRIESPFRVLSKYASGHF